MRAGNGKRANEASDRSSPELFPDASSPVRERNRATRKFALAGVGLILAAVVVGSGLLISSLQNNPAPVAGPGPVPPLSSEPSSARPTAIPTHDDGVGSSAAPEDAATDWVISTAGWGELKLGERVPDDFTFAVWDEDFCEHVGAWVFEGFEKGDQPDYVLQTEDQDPDNDVDLIIIYTNTVSTPSGLHVGSTLEEAKAAVPELERVGNRNAGAEFWAVTDDLGRIAFEFLDGVVYEIQVSSPEIGPFSALTGGTAGTCVA